MADMTIASAHSTLASLICSSHSSQGIFYGILKSLLLKSIVIIGSEDYFTFLLLFFNCLPISSEFSKNFVTNFKIDSYVPIG
jgi:hypothetical protein